MANYWKMVNQVLEDADIVLEVLDSRLIDETRNSEIEKKVEESGKRMLYVVNKCDLVSEDYVRRIKKRLDPCVFVSAKQKLGTIILRKAILQLAKARSKDKVIVGIVGYPNTGKSSVINALKGKHSAKASPQAGYTRGTQYVNVGSGILMIDTPGVIPFKEGDELKLAIIASKNPSELNDPETVAERIIDFCGGAVESAYGIEPNISPEVSLANIALRIGKLKKGGLADTETAARMVIKDWQRGKIKLL